MNAAPGIDGRLLQPALGNATARQTWLPEHIALVDRHIRSPQMVLRAELYRQLRRYHTGSGIANFLYRRKQILTGADTMPRATPRWPPRGRDEQARRGNDGREQRVTLNCSAMFELR
jgi:hypothetical protein